MSIGLPRSRGLKGVMALSSRKTTATVGAGGSRRTKGSSDRIAALKRRIDVAVRRSSSAPALPITVSPGASSRFQSRLDFCGGPV